MGPTGASLEVLGCCAMEGAGLGGGRLATGAAPAPHWGHQGARQAPAEPWNAWAVGQMPAWQGQGTEGVPGMLTGSHQGALPSRNLPALSSRPALGDPGPWSCASHRQAAPHLPGAPCPPPRGDLPRGFLSLHSSFQPATPCVLSLDPPSDAEPPKIRVPRHLRQTYIRQVGETVNLQIPFQGSPKPQASWTHDGHALDAQRVNVRTGDQDSILFIRSAQRSDSGCYELTMRLEGLEAKAAIDILVIGTGPGEAGLPGWDLETPPPTRADADGTGPGSVTGAQSWGWRFCGKPWHPPHPPSRSGPAEKPGPPSSIRLLDVWGCNAALEWMPPQDTGNTELLGYTVQKADRKTGQWFTVLERYHPTTCTISDLIVGNAYSFRVFSENQCGLSATAATTKELARIQKADIVAKTKGFVERDFSEAPSFTQPLADHTSTPGYSTQLFCSVRASPKPKIIWMKNNMDIQGDPKYRALSEQGVCTLEIRKPSPFDSGVYTCKAINVLGEASVDCRLEVKGKASATH
uniref:Myosin-binding protein H n=1 Tax=Canis lupus familiaris TaxID=9615 RepID=A0A8C0PY73_CANLF